MKQKELERFLNSVDSRYRAVLVASKRAKQLQQGLRPLFEGKNLKVTSMALEEFINEKVEFYEVEPETGGTGDEPAEASGTAPGDTGADRSGSDRASGEEP
ncbi:DNA-directed RNA polymerase subunit omega [bacterium]|nr:DNA-directed RNA polymerase subunit omega [candidate division CSSED10-310 bacterium]